MIMLGTNRIFFLVILVISCPYTAQISAETVTIQVGEFLEVVVLDRQVNFIYYFNRTAEGQSPALRLVVSSENASSLHPLLFTVLQTKGVTSWSLPYVESGYTFLSVERTLCPLLNNDADRPDGPLKVVMEISTTSPTPVRLTINSSFVQDFYLRLNTVASLTASPSSPAHLLFKHSPQYRRVRVRFSSMDETSRVCAIASIQKSYCPVEELLDNPNHRGIFQTMRSQAAIDVELVPVNNNTGIITDRQQTQFDFFYIVISVFPSNDTCESLGVATTSRLITLEVVDNFNPVAFTGMELTKNVNITVETAIPEWSYGVAVVVPTVIYFIFYFVALGWIIFADWFQHHKHPLEELIEVRKAELEEYLASQNQPLIQGLDNDETPTVAVHNPEAGLTEAALVAARQLSNDANSLQQDDFEASTDEVDGGSSVPPHCVTASSPAHLTSPGSKDQADYSTGFKKTLSYFKRSQRDRVTDSVQAGSRISKKPSLLSVVFGNHYNEAISPVTTPSPHYPQYLHSPTYSMNSPRNPILGLHRHRSVSETHAANPVDSSGTRNSMSTTEISNSHTVPYQVKRSTSMGSPARVTSRSGSIHARPRLNPSISLASPVMNQVSLHCHGLTGVRPRTKQGMDSPDGGGLTEIRSGGHLNPKVSYSRAVEMGLVVEEGEGEIDSDIARDFDAAGFIHDKEPFPINMYMCELPEFDETSKAQKQYNRLSWYLIAVIAFYAIPAYQLVITYQQLLTVSGNQDICYFNSLCSYPWRVTDSLTLSAFNSIYSNIGYFILGFLFIIIAYRRRRVYYAVEKVVNSPFITNKQERVGIPQHFGIYYAVGLSLMAEGFMSVAYHICPGKANYQFDTTFMFVLAGLGIFKLLESRTPDLHPGLHKLLVLFAAIIVMVVVGVLYAHSPVFYALFFIVHIASTFVVTFETYYRWQVHLNPQSLKSFFEYITSRPFWPFKQLPKFVQAVLANIVNWGFAIYAVTFQPPDFGTFFLIILLTNFIVLLFYYVITKFIYNERPSPRPILFIILSLLFWACGIYFYTQAVTNWLDSPAVSRDGNRDCVAYFYDAHDMWHFSSAFALFFSFLMLMTLDDDTEGTERTKLRVF